MSLLSWAAGPVLPYLAGAAGAAILVTSTFGAVQTWRIGRLKYDLNVAAGKLDALQDAKDASERLRALEGQGATVSYDGLAAACAARLPIYVQAGRTLERITNAKPNPDGSRGMCDAQCVRELAGQAGPVGEAGTLPQ
ncbi:hypothetical protein [Caulobacter hibisci]|uniref:Uncharacterized protein n=1 Tax=Caulobacter hibisci TaxID=2035993 RepID=A0ABS0SRW5_9CAUL|nr:hypothetical protein [Caulobacter hibisci]MBI1682370.1 hypothetical protein [Caulobacter hibisci]